MSINAARRAGRRGDAVLGRAVAVLAAVLLALLPGPARAAGSAPTPTPTLAQIYRSLGLDQEPADYVILVDTSGSMAQQGLYASVRSTLGSFLHGLSPSDSVALFTFDSRTTPRYIGPARDEAKILSELPTAPTPGGSTDIGAALDAALSRLERPGAAQVASVVLLTDGQQDPPAGSAYPKATGPGWNALHQRAEKVAKGTDLSGYALPLRDGATGADLLGTVVPDTTVLKSSGIQDLRGYLQQAADRILARKAAVLLGPDVGRGVTATWSGPGQLDLTHGSAAGSLTLSSTDRHVPLTVSGLGASLDGSRGTLTGLPGTVTLGPGQSRTFDVRVSDRLGAGLLPVRHTAGAEAGLRVVGQVTSSWSGPLSARTDLRVPPTVRVTAATVRLRATVGNPWLLPVAGGVLLLVLLLLWLRWVYTHRPRLRGELLIGPAFGDQLPERIDLSGRGMRLQRLSVGGRGRVRGRRRARRDDRRVDLLIRYTPDGTSARESNATCAPSSVVVINGVRFSYHGRPSAGVRAGGGR